MFLPECSSVDEDQSFVSHAEKDFSKSLKKSTQNPKIFRNFQVPKNIIRSSNCSAVHEECSFGKRAGEKLCQKSEKISEEVRKKTVKLKLPWKKVFPHKPLPVTWNSVCRTLSWYFCRKLRNVLANVPKQIDFFKSYPKNNLSPKNSSGSLECPFDDPSRKYRQELEYDSRLCFLTCVHFSLKCASGHV